MPKYLLIACLGNFIRLAELHGQASPTRFYRPPHSGRHTSVPEICPVQILPLYLFFILKVEEYISHTTCQPPEGN